MLLVDGFVIALVALIGIGGTAVILSYKRKNETPKERASRRRKQGKYNAETADADSELVCTSCSKAVDPAKDVYTQECWWHVDCYKSVTKV